MAFRRPLTNRPWAALRRSLSGSFNSLLKLPDDLVAVGHPSLNGTSRRESQPRKATWSIACALNWRCLADNRTAAPTQIVRLAGLLTSMPIGSSVCHWAQVTAPKLPAPHIILMPPFKVSATHWGCLSYSVRNPCMGSIEAAQRMGITAAS
jgi:hypothetical protein